MAGKWEGFSEEDIGRYLESNEETQEKVVPKRQASNLLGQVKKNVTRERMLSGIKNKINDNEQAIPAEARLSKDVQESVPLVNSDERRCSSSTESEADVSPSHVITGTSPVCLKVIEGNSYELFEKDTKSVSNATLEVFQTRQKMLEEQNRKRKELLAKVLSDRKKQTSEEAKRLHNIQEELHKLDLLLSNDVGILRNQIEDASLEFVEAQKRYNKAEKEFLEAKHTLFSKLEKKELLTRHLCTIIEQSEMRKAQKLSELMEKLKINETTVEEKPGLNAVILSPYYESALSDLKSNKPIDKDQSGIINKGYEANKESPQSSRTS